MPDDAALAALDEFLRRLHAEILVLAAQLFNAGVKDDKVVHQLQQPRLGAHLQEVAVQQVGLGHKGATFLDPAQVIFLRRLDGGVTQALGVVARHDPLHGREKGLDELFFLVVQVLADALGHRDGGAFQLQHAQGDAVDVDHHVRALGGGLGISTLDRDLFGNGKVVVVWVLPVDQPDRHIVLAHAGLHLDAVAQQVVDVAVAVIQALAGVGGDLVQFMQRARDEAVAHALLGQPRREQLGLDVVVVALGFVAEIVVAEPLLEQGDDPGLGAFFDLADGAHINPAPV